MLSNLTPTELSVLKLMSKALDNQSIADRLGLKLRNTQNYVQKINDKLVPFNKGYHSRVLSVLIYLKSEKYEK